MEGFQTPKAPNLDAYNVRISGNPNMALHLAFSGSAVTFKISC